MPARPFFGICSTLDRSAAYLVASDCYFSASSVIESSREKTEGQRLLISIRPIDCTALHTKMADQGGGALKGLRLLTVDRGPQGFGFHMYTNKVLKVNA